MHKHRYSFASRSITVVIIVALLGISQLTAQPKYRTFSQDSLALKKAKAGKAYSSQVCFTFHYIFGDTVNDLHVTFNGHIRSVENAGGFPNVTVTNKGKTLQLSGMDVYPGDSVTICLTTDKKAPGTKATAWHWTRDGNLVGTKNKNLLPDDDVQLLLQPNGGNVLEHLYKKVIVRPEGVVIGKPRPDSAKFYGWIRYMKADRKYFTHIGEPRCLDFIVTGSGGQKPFVKELKNPHVKKHDNHLLGELHALKLAVIANDNGVTEPLDSNATLFSELLYNDTVNVGDACNGKTVREIIALADSAMTYCANFDSADYADLDACISRINAAFDGPYIALSFSPFVLAGTQSLDDVYFLHPNPAAAPVARPIQRYALDLSFPEQFEVQQNYPNPFNPSTMIQFSLPEPSVVTLKVYNMLGQEVATLLDRSEIEDGEQSVEFIADNLPSGIYFYRIMVTANGEETRQTYSQVKRMVLLK